MLARIRPGSQNFGLGRSRGQNIDLGLRPGLKCLVSDSISGPQKSGLGLGIGSVVWVGVTARFPPILSTPISRLAANIGSACHTPLSTPVSRLVR